MKFLEKLFLVITIIIFSYPISAQTFKSDDILTPEKIQDKLISSQQPDNLGFYQVQFLDKPTKLRFNNGNITSEIVMKYNNGMEYGLTDGNKIVEDLTTSIAQLFPNDNFKISYDIPTFGSCIGNSIIYPNGPIIISIYHDYSINSKKGDILIRIVY